MGRSPSRSLVEAEVFHNGGYIDWPTKSVDFFLNLLLSLRLLVSSQHNVPQALEPL